MKYTDEAKLNFKALSNNPYPGRGIVLGESADGKSYVQVISKQSGCAEILDNVIKIDYWDINAMADAIYSIIKYPAMYNELREQGLAEVNQITWDKAGAKVINIYRNLINR